jgi:cellulose synthase/poly-beta-1,6-N-acetylglucosamine synthase-like glycosyltransferase
VFANNLEDAPLPVRVVAMATTFWLLGETVRPERLFTFSSHSMSFQTLIDVGFWQSDIVTEDSRIFVQALLRYDGDYRVAPLYLPVSMDAVQGRTVRESLVALYKQQRRWAYGVENFPFMAWNFSANPTISRHVKFRYLFNQLEGVYSWATAPIIIFILGWLPLRLSSATGSDSAFIQAAPVVLHWLLTLSLVGLGVCASLTLTVLASTGRRRSVSDAVVTVLSWALFPLAMLLFGSIPATDAATRLALGNYLGFNVTKKVRRVSESPSGS